MAEYYLIFAQFKLRLLFDLDTRASLLASTANLEAGPRFAEI